MDQEAFQLMNKFILDQVQADAIARYPEESCGYVVEGEGYIPVANIAEDPLNTFAVALADTKKVMNKNTIAFVHSHPDGRACPSAADMIGQIIMCIPWGIVVSGPDSASSITWFGDEVPTDKAPLIGRGFCHGITDCYALIRDWYALEKSISLPEVPRDWEWWQSGESLYDQGFELAGFSEVPIDEVVEGDVLLFKIRSETSNHGGIYIGNGLLLHHACGMKPIDKSRLSAREPVGRFLPYVTHCLRHESLK